MSMAVATAKRDNNNSIAEMTMLRGIVMRWKAMTLKRRHSSRHSSTVPPAGFLAVYVGQNRTRFFIPLRFLHLPIFVSLLHKAEEEYGFKFSGGIVLPCEVEQFERVLIFLNKDEKKYGRLEMSEFFKLISEVGFDSSSCRQQQQQEQSNSSSAYDTLLLPCTKLDS